MTPEIKQRIEQVQRGEVPEGYKRTKVGIVPCDWEETRFKKKFSRVTRKNKENNDNVLTISAQYGLINQRDFFNKDIASDDKSNYYLLENGEFAYNKSYSNGYPFGALKRLNMYNKGIVSPLYICFAATKENKCPDFYVQYFEAGKMNCEILAFAQEGARNHGLLNISVDDFFNSNIVVPSLPEQEKISELLSAQDKIIALKEKFIEEKKLQKKALMQQLLTGKKRLPGFSGEWVNIKLGDVFEERVETNCQDLELLSVTGTNGVVPRSTIEIKDNSSEDKSKYLKICKGDIGYNTMRMWQGVSALSEYEGIVSPAYTILIPSPEISAKYFSYLFKMHAVIFLFYRFSQGIVDDTRSLKYHEFAKLHLTVPKNKKEQESIADILTVADQEIQILQKELDQEKQKKKALMQLLLTGIVRVNK